MKFYPVLSKFAVWPVLLAMIVASLSAATVVAPSNHASAEGNALSSLPVLSSGRVVQVQYAASQLTGLNVGDKITGLRWRANAATSSSPATATSNMTVKLAAATKAINNLSNTFAENMSGEQTVYNGAVSIPAGAFPLNGSPNAWSTFTITFSSPYTYTGGDLVLYLTHQGFGTSILLDAIGTSDTTNYNSAISGKAFQGASGATADQTAPSSVITQFDVVASGDVNVIGTPAAQFNTGTLSFTVPAGTNRLLVVGASDSGATDVSNVTFGASTLTRATQLTDTYSVDSFWVLPMGTSASPTTATLTMTTAGTGKKTLSAIVFENVDQANPYTTPVPTPAKGNALSNSLTVTSSAGDMVIDLFDTWSSSSNLANTANNGQTQRSNDGGSLSPGAGYGRWSTSTKAGASSVTTGWTYNGTGQAFIQLALNIRRLSGSAPTVTTATQTNIAATSATLGGNVTADGGVSVTERGIVWATTASPTTSNNKVSNGSGTGVFSATVGSLTTNSTIYVRAYAINSIGTSYGSEISFSTDVTKPTVVSIVRANSAAQGTTPAAPTATFRVTYSEAVTGVVATNFEIENVGTGSTTGTIGTPTGGPTGWDVPVTITGGSGEFRIKVKN